MTREKTKEGAEASRQVHTG